MCCGCCEIIFQNFYLIERLIHCAQSISKKAKNFKADLNSDGSTVRECKADQAQVTRPTLGVKK